LTDGISIVLLDKRFDLRRILFLSQHPFSYFPLPMYEGIVALIHVSKRSVHQSRVEMACVEV
jgi:hypothetical protein